MTTDALDTIVRTGLLASIVLVGIILVAPRIIKAYAFPPWARNVLWTLAAVCTVWVPLGLMQTSASPTKALGLAAIVTWTFLSGLIVGIGFTLVCSGALKKQQHDKPQKA